MYDEQFSENCFQNFHQELIKIEGSLSCFFFSQRIDTFDTVTQMPPSLHQVFLDSVVSLVCADCVHVLCCMPSL